jgi:lipid II:glycine glycyltransferase (peptidoglycan interpeptide bridge formation enzyme)
MAEHIRIGRLDKETWSGIIDAFDDANLYQTWSYGMVRQGLNHVEHVVIEDKAGRIKAAAQVWLRKVPLLPCGVAYIKWGPLWLTRDGAPDPEALRQMLLALREEYALKRRLLLRITPCQSLLDQSADLPGLYARADFQPTAFHAYRTIVADLRPEPADIRKRFGRNFKSNLGKAEGAGLTIQRSTDVASLDQFMIFFHQMLKRKKYQEFMNVDDFKAIHLDLPERHKPIIYLAEKDAQPVAAIVLSVLGHVGLYIHGATADDALRTNASFLLHWQAINDMKARGVYFYDTNGVNAKRNPGGYQFKSGLGGKDKREFDYESYETCDSPLSCLCFIWAERLRFLWWDTLRFLRKVQRRLSPGKPESTPQS